MGDIRRILHVEDDPDIREIAFLALSELGGFDVLQCASGTDALAHAAGFAPELLLLDVMMPGMSGVETLAALRKLEALTQTPAIFMTSKDVSSELHAEMDVSAIGVIPKPFDPMRLPDQLRQIVRDA